MKNILYFSFLFCLLGSCKKEEKTSTPIVQFNFSVQNLSDVYVNRGSSQAIKPTFKLLSGIPESISLSVSGLPDMANFAAGTVSGIPDFSPALNFSVDENMPAGVYPFKLIATSTTAGTKVYDLNLQVANINDCSPALAGFYMQVTDIFDTTRTNNATIFPSTGEEDCVSIGNFLNSGYEFTIKAYLDCASNTFVVPSQPFNSSPSSATIVGHGIFTDTSLVLHFRENLDSLDHTATFSRHAR